MRLLPKSIHWCRRYPTKFNSGRDIPRSSFVVKRRAREPVFVVEVGSRPRRNGMKELTLFAHFLTIKETGAYSHTSSMGSNVVRCHDSRSQRIALAASNAKQKKYHVRNWAEYNEGLRRRGDLTVWFDEEAIANWKADKTGKPGGQRVYSDMAIETGLVVRMVYKLAYRQTEGFLHSIASLLGLGIEIPDYSTLCRRSRLLRKKLRIPKAASTQPIHLMIDSTGLRIHVGNARKPPKQRAWRKLHIAVDRETGNIVASELTASRARDATRVPALLTQIQAPLVSVAADSAYDKEAVYEAIEAHSPGRRTRVVIPPQRNATLSQNSNTAMQERDRHIRAIERHGRREWYKLSGYTKRSMVENAVYRYKAIIGPEMRARTLARQRVEHRIGCEILNKMAALGMPDTYCAG